MQLKDKYAVVTGGTAGIGLAIARSLQAAGAKVLVVGRDPKRLGDMRFAGFDTLGADFALEVERAKVVSHLADMGQPVDIFINNAGMMTPIGLAGIDAQTQIRREIEVNLNAPVQFCLELLPYLLQRPEAALVNVTTGLVYAPMFDSPGYAAAKSALHAFTQSLRWQTRATSVRILEVMPPLVDTDMVRHIKGSKAKPEAVARALVKALEGTATELHVGQTKFLYYMSRVAPNLASKMINNGREIPTGSR